MLNFKGKYMHVYYDNYSSNINLQRRHLTAESIILLLVN